MNNPLVKPQGNFGNINGDTAAAARYIECKLDKMAMNLFSDIKENAIDWSPNYDNTDEEPVTLPVSFPNILCNGTFGIGFGHSTGIPPHNLGETIDKAIEIINDPRISLEKVIEGYYPDFPTGGTIINKSDFLKLYSAKTDEAIDKLPSLKVRGTIEIGKDGNLVITEVPFMTTTTNIIEDIKKHRDKSFPEVKDIKDSTNNKNGIKINIILKKGSNAEIVRNKLFKATRMQQGMAVRLKAIKGISPTCFNIKDIFVEWIEYRKNTLKRIFRSKSKKLYARLNIIEGLLKAYNMLDKVIEIGKTANGQKDCIAKLEALGFNELQAKDISNIPLYKLSKISADALESEKADKESEYNEYKNLISSDKKLSKYIITELKDIKKQFAKPRKTKVIDDDISSEESLVENSKHTILLTKDGFVKKLSDNIPAQKSGGKGRNVGKLRDNDFVINTFNSSNHDTLLLFSNVGKVYSIRTYELQDTTLTSYGTKIEQYIKLPTGESIVSALNITTEHIKNDKTGYLVFATKDGLIKRTLFSKYVSVPKSGFMATRLKEGDSIVGVDYGKNEESSVIITTKKGVGNRFNIKDVSLTERTTLGIKSLSVLDPKDEVVSFNLLGKSDTKSDLFVITAKGEGKRVTFKSFTTKSRTKTPVVITKLKSTDSVVKTLVVNDDENILIVGSQKIIKVPASDVGEALRSASGKKIVSLGKGEKIIDCAKENA